MNPKKRDWVSQSLYHMCKQNWQAKRKSCKDQTPMKQSNTGHEKEENKKKIEITFQINLSVTIQVSCFDDLINFFFGQLIMKVHHRPLEFFSTYKPVILPCQTLNISRISASVSVSFIRYPSVEKFSKVNDAIALKKNVNLVQFKLTESDRSISFHPTTAFLALSLLDLISNSPDCLHYNSWYVVWRI